MVQMNGRRTEVLGWHDKGCLHGPNLGPFSQNDHIVSAPPAILDSEGMSDTSD